MLCTRLERLHRLSFLEEVEPLEPRIETIIMPCDPPKPILPSPRLTTKYTKEKNDPIPFSVSCFLHSLSREEHELGKKKAKEPTLMHPAHMNLQTGYRLACLSCLVFRPPTSFQFRPFLEGKVNVGEEKGNNAM